jgi:hypothetical protein
VAKKCFVANQKMQNEPNFFHPLRIHNLNKNNKLQQKMNNGHLAKTNPIKPVHPNAGCIAKDARHRTKKCQTKPIFKRQK